ncbi:Predicted arabinose efflux permease, MFS family [Pseudovibrio ascidiaceicola]|uniref:Predicted arabinose efflux permease, MFS family n=1 Tax=Pseudovibrio ascidiaceicola TaxID=285279 RepID=A0A1I4FMI5_9HYPH|nr:MFS transporter [Pseudovibrio ascidiaceicola]SFL17771.1 Predicted arabinose efflux permease, MFS family [Pseudovibrio ascidiaceicola]
MTVSRLILFYQLCLTSFQFPRAMLGVLFPYLVTVYLAESPERVSYAMTASMLPNLLVLLFAGALADRLNKRKLLVLLHIANAIPVVALTMLLHFGSVGFENLILFALLSGTTLAFVQPTLDGMLNHISSMRIRRGVTLSVGMLYLVTLAGFLLASSVEWVGVAPLLGISGALFLAGIATSLHLPDTPALAVKDRPSILSEIRAGLALVLSSKTLRLPVLLMSSAGLILGGPYAVLVPLILRDTYQATGFDFALAFAVFMVGGACSSGILLKLGAIRNPVPLLVAGYSMGGFALLFWAISPPYWAFLGSIFFWGIGGGICLNMSRTILQEQAPSTHKSRVLSVMYLGDEGGAPLGSLITGALITTLSLSSASVIPGAAVLLISLLLLLALSAQRSEAKATQDGGR